MIDEKINQLLEITSNFIYIEYYSHANSLMYKIDNEFTSYNKDILVLNKVSDGIEQSLDLAIEHITKKKNEFYGNLNE